MSLLVSAAVWREIVAHLEAAYPEEGVGVLLGCHAPDGARRVLALLPLPNHWPAEGEGDASRTRRYLIPPQAMLKAEEEAERRGLAVLGIVHSHPDHPSRPSAFDQTWALPFFSYLIVSVRQGRAATAQSWRLREDRSAFDEEPLRILEAQPE